MEGYIFETKTKLFNKQYYFIQTNNKRKTKTIANKFLNYFMKKYENCGFIPPQVVQNTFNKIYNNMYQATLIDKTKQLKCYNIYTKYSGESVPTEVVTIITKEGE